MHASVQFAPLFYHCIIWILFPFIYKMASGLDSSFISFETLTYTSAKIKKEEGNAIINAINDTEGFFDILAAVHKLKNNPELKDKCPHLLKSVTSVGKSDREKILGFIYTLLNYISFPRLLDIFREVGFNDLSFRITTYLYGNDCREIRPTKLTGSTFFQNFLYRQKSYLDDNIFNQCRKQYLQSLFDDLILNLDLENSNVNKDVGKLAIVTWLRVQQHERSHDIKHIINDMLSKLPQSVDKTLPEIVFLSKSAVAHELDGDSEASERYMSEAASFSAFCDDPLVKAFLFHDTRYIHQLRYMRSKDEDTRVKVQSDCLNALHYFSSYENNLCLYMWRAHSLYIIHNLLKIGQNFEIDASEETTSDELAQATSIFYSLERCFQSGGLPIEQRRKMIYCVLRARMHQIGGDIDIAVAYLSEAYSLRDDGAFFRVEEIHLTFFKRILIGY